MQSRDATAVAACFTQDAVYQNVPQSVLKGRSEIERLFAPILGASERVEWEVLSMAVEGPRVHLERIDRFWIQGKQYSVACHAVITIDMASELIASFIDYVDLGEWRATLGDVLGK